MNTEHDSDCRNRRSSPFRDIDPAEYDAEVKSMDTPKHLISAEPIIYKLNEWEGNIEDRRFNLVGGDLTFECFGTPSKRNRLFVFPSAAGRTDTKTIFHRVSWHPWFDGICLNIEDPTYKALGLTAAPGWFFGTKATHAMPIAIEIVRRIQQRYAIPDTEVYFIGSSSGGFAALWMADAIQGATALAANPQFYATRWSSSVRYAKFGIDLLSPEFSQRENLDHIRINGKSRFLIITNYRSKVDFVDQIPFFIREKELEKIYYGINKYENLYILCKYTKNIGSTSPHIILNSAKQTRALLETFSAEIPFENMSSIMNMINEMEYSYQHLADKLFFIDQWEAFTRDWDLPLDLPASSIQKNAARFFLKGSDQAAFEVVIAPRASSFRIFLKSRDHTHLEKFEQMAEHGLGNFSMRGSTLVFEFGKFSKTKAREGLKNAVASALPYFTSAATSTKPTILDKLSRKLRIVAGRV